MTKKMIWWMVISFLALFGVAQGGYYLLKRQVEASVPDVPALVWAGPFRYVVFYDNVCAGDVRADDCFAGHFMDFSNSGWTGVVHDVYPDGTLPAQGQS